MKATTIIIAAALALTSNILFAGNYNAPTAVANTNTAMSVTALAPVVPAEADFADAFIADFTALAPVTPQEADFTDAFLADFTALAPITPSEAQFEDLSFESALTLNLAPVTPATAGFEETAELTSLAPVVPAEADFE